MANVVMVSISSENAKWLKRLHCADAIKLLFGHKDILSNSANPSIPMPTALPPDPRNRLVTIRTQPIALGHPIFLHHKTESSNQRGIAMMTAGVFPFAHLSRNISGVHIFQPGLLAVFDHF